ncbi:MAG TPA: aspartate aminotransferase family protein [Candidatus Acidoferrum sp.]|jgi:glutamate-1-semialdehyde 2,1-aminomutase|nr:aspartate aminotransferase family protein [Candidatus Acidoferrum sp.]
MVDPVEVYRRTTPASRALHESAVKVMPGGTTRTTTYFDPYPLYIDRGDGCRIWDVDGTERIDMLGNYTAMILGHAHPKVVEAIHRQAARGTAFAAANRIEVELATLLCERVPSLELVRFCNSGTEATMFAMRLARAFTGRPKIARIEGGYHGTHDYAEVSTHPAPMDSGSGDRPIAVPDSIGTPQWALTDTVVLPFNNPDAAERILREHAGQLAAVILEPIIGAGGVIAASHDFLERLRSVTHELRMLLIFDEVISLRVAPGGAQQLYGITPDLTTMGKIIGGGLPVAAFGGRADVMELMDPRREPNLPQGGTYNGNPLGMAAGVAAMNELTPDVYESLNRKGARVKDQLTEVFASHGLPAQVNAAGSLLAIHFTNVPVVDYRTKATSNPKITHDFFLALVNHGVLMAPRAMSALSTPMEERDIQEFVDAVDAVISEQLPRWVANGSLAR